MRYILITHCHSDHFADLHIVWEYIRNLNPEYKVKVIAPKGALKKLLKLYKALETPRTKKRILTFFEFVELKPGDKVVFEKFSVKAYKMEHNVKHSLGYVLNFNNHTVGFSGDACLCYGVEQLIKDCKVAFIDSSSLQSNKKHLSVGECLELKQKYLSTKIYSVHVSDKIVENFSNKLDIPYVGEEIKF